MRIGQVLQPIIAITNIAMAFRWQVLINLIENALRYSNGKSITLSVTQNGANAVLTVKDDGIGIAPEHHDRLFERFYRVDKSRSRELGGTGLGLAIVKHIALIHNGKAEIISSPGKGAEFRITLPLLYNSLQGAVAK